MSRKKIPKKLTPKIQELLSELAASTTGVGVVVELSPGKLYCGVPLAIRSFV